MNAPESGQIWKSPRENYLNIDLVRDGFVHFRSECGPEKIIKWAKVSIADWERAVKAEGAVQVLEYEEKL